MKPITITLPFDSYVSVTIALRTYMNGLYSAEVQDRVREILADIEKQAAESYFKPNA